MVQSLGYVAAFLRRTLVQHRNGQPWYLLQMHTWAIQQSHLYAIHLHTKCLSCIYPFFAFFAAAIIT